jgi:hypothetical protein
MRGPITKTTFLAILAWLVAFSPAFCQDAKQHAANDAAPPETVIVTGKRPGAETLHDIVPNFVDAHGKPSPKIGQLTRWVTPVCPEVRNLPAGFGNFITARIKAIAASVGAPTRESCKLNIEIIFTSDPQAIASKIAEKDPRLLGYHFVHDTVRAATVTEPIQAWYVTSSSNALETYIDDPYHGTPSGAPGRFSHGLYSVFNHVLVLVNTDKVAGYPIGPVADYIAMLSLSQARTPDNCAELASILDYLSPNCPEKPESLTVADKAYLEGLYSMDKYEIGSLQKSNISEHMEQSMGGH